MARNAPRSASAARAARAPAGPSRRGRRPARPRSAATRARILAAALPAFARHGFEGASTRQIAAAADVNQGLITYHFAGKLALWQAAVDDVFARLRASLDERRAELDGADAATRVRLAVRHFVRFSAENPELHRLMAQEGKSDGPRLRWLVERHVRPLFELSTSLIREAQRAGFAPPLEPIHLHYVLIGAAAHPFVVAPEFQLLCGRDPAAAGGIDAYAAAIEQLLLSGRKS
jgi:AcrR family transcriptional regulator